MLSRSKLSITLLILLLNSSFHLIAEDKKDSTYQNSLDNVWLIKNLDSLTNQLFSGYYNFYDTTKFSNYTFDIGDIPKYPDSIVAERISSIPSILPLTLNRYVRNFIDLYAINKREQVEKMIGLSALYFPIFEEAIDRKNLPHNLKFLPIVESALNPNAVSRAGATGLWQIMYSTGRMLHLDINSYIDERRDPYLSTEAALNYLSDLHEVFGDWLLVIAAYNCGPGNVNKAIRRSGGKRNFWQIMPYLPRETRGYVPAFIAACYVMNEFEAYNLRPKNPKFSFNAIDTVHIKDRLTLSHAADHLDMDLDELTFLNPALKKKIIPKTKSGYVLKLPINKITTYELLKDSIINSMPEPEVVEVESKTGNGYSAFSYPDKEKLTYTVKSGDNLGFIAEWYDCSARDIRYWNNLYGNLIKVGQKITIFIKKDKIARYNNIDGLSFKEKQDIELNGYTYKNDAKVDEKCQCIYYEVKPGDTIWEISRKYPGVTVDEIKRFNQLNDTKYIKPGMVLKIQI